MCLLEVGDTQRAEWRALQIVGQVGQLYRCVQSSVYRPVPHRRRVEVRPVLVDRQHSVVLQRSWLGFFASNAVAEQRHKTAMSQLVQQQDLLHQLHVGRDVAALTVGSIQVDRLLPHTAGDVRWLPRYHLDCHWTLRSIVVVNAVTKIDSFSDAVSDLLSQYNPPDVGAIESIPHLRL